MERERERDRQTDRQTDREREREREKGVGREMKGGKKKEESSLFSLMYPHMVIN